MLVDWRDAKLLSGPCQILAHQTQCAFDALKIPGPPVSAFTRSPDVPYLNNLTHLAFRIIAY